MSKLHTKILNFTAKVERYNNTTEHILTTADIEYCKNLVEEGLNTLDAATLVKKSVSTYLATKIVE